MNSCVVPASSNTICVKIVLCTMHSTSDCPCVQCDILSTCTMECVPGFGVAPTTFPAVRGGFRGSMPPPLLKATSCQHCPASGLVVRRPTGLAARTVGRYGKGPGLVRPMPTLWKLTRLLRPRVFFNWWLKPLDFALKWPEDLLALSRWSRARLAT